MLRLRWPAKLLPWWAKLLPVVVLGLAVAAWFLPVLAGPLILWGGIAVGVLALGYAVTAHWSKARQTIRIHLEVTIKEAVLPLLRSTVCIVVKAYREEKGQLLLEYTKQVTLKVRAKDRDQLLELAQHVYEKQLRIIQSHHPQALVVAPQTIGEPAALANPASSSIDTDREKT